MEIKAHDKIEIDDLYDIEKCAQWIELNNFNKTCLQFPDSLLADSADVALSIEKKIEKKVYILGDTSYGSCCIDEVAAQHINADSIIHFGHACLTPTARLPVFHVLPKKDIDVASVVDKFQSAFRNSNTCILFFFDVAYAHKIEEISNVLKTTYKNITFSTLNSRSNVDFVDTKGAAPISILGRSFELNSGLKIEDYEACFLGDDDKTFTILSMSIPAKRWYFDYTSSIIPIESRSTPWLKRRRFLVEKLKDAKVVGIVAATLGIKEYLESIKMVKSVLKQQNIKSYILSVGKINPSKLANFPEIDAFVVITCPENDVFDSKDFFKPILLPYEVELAFNSARPLCKHYCMDFRQILPGGDNYKEFACSTAPSVSLVSGKLLSGESEAPSVDEMNALAIKTPGAVAIGKAGAQFLQDRFWKGVEQRLGKDNAHSATIGRTGLATGYQNEPSSEEVENV